MKIDVYPYFFWNDGVLSRLITWKTVRVPGRFLLHFILMGLKGRGPVTIIGSVNNALIRDYFESFDIPIIVIEASFSSAYDIANSINFSELSSDVFICLPSPKQEMIAEILYSEFQARYYCFGGALNMLIGNEKSAPNFISAVGIEWLWRLKTDTKRRLHRLFFIVSNVYKIKKLNLHINII